MLLKNKYHFKRIIKNLKDKLNIDNKIVDSGNITITHSWLLGFIDASFTTAGVMPRLKFENHEVMDRSRLESIEESTNLQL